MTFLFFNQEVSVIDYVITVLFILIPGEIATPLTKLTVPPILEPHGRPVRGLPHQLLVP